MKAFKLNPSTNIFRKKNSFTLREHDILRGTNKKSCVYLKFGDGDGPNLCRVKKVDVSSTFIENIFRSGMTLVSSSVIITIKIDKKKNF